MSIFNNSNLITTTANLENRTEDALGPSSSAVALESTAPYRAAETLWKVCPPVILLLGTFGNSMILAILRIMPQGAARGAMSLFFAALAVSDLVLLYTGLLRQWLIYTMTLELRNLHDVMCKLHLFAVYLSAMTSAWFLVAMTWQRVVSVMWPHRIGLLSTRRRAQITVLLLIVFLVAINAHFLVVFTLHEPPTNTTSSFCGTVDNDAVKLYAGFVFPWIDLVVTSLLPSSLLLVGNVLLATTVARSARLARRMTAPAGSARSDVREKAASSLTVTLMSVSVTYLFLTLPVCVFLIVHPYLHVGNDVLYQAWLELLWAVCNLMWYCNSIVNFYLYCLTGTRFRAQCKRLLCCARAARTTVSSGVFVSMTTGGSQSTVCEDKDNEQDDDDF